jgi:16S rRNA processing protein RimM
MVQDLILLGLFGGAHGVRGELRLKSYTARPESIASYGCLTTQNGRRLELASVRPRKDTLLIARVKGVTDRAGAEALAHQKLYVPRAALGEPQEDEFFHADLIGLKVETSDGRVVGRVTGLFDFGAGDLLEIAPVDGGKTVLLPFTRAVVPAVDLAAGRLLIVPAAEAAGEGPDDGK